MAETRSLIIACVFVCVLFVSNTLLCTADDCTLVVGKIGAEGIPIIKTGNLVDTGEFCSTDFDHCNEFCSEDVQDVAGKTVDGKSGKCLLVDNNPEEQAQCACCNVKL
ncbi:hypothetical protein MKW92_033660 [Papaver armeniacum]|nr:hypothetical protein MKW92_033660 [Papaver armeniacum]